MHDATPIDWESFYRGYREPGYVAGFQILNKIGSGAFGLVFKARKVSIARDYAIKFLKVDDESVRDAIMSELAAVRLFAQVDHPNLVSIEDRGEVDGIPYIVMNHAGDTTLRHRLEQGALRRDEALRIVGQVARGLRALHEHSLVHFDLKPGNVFLKGDFARLGDYGLSRLITQSRNSLTFGRGTPYYMAPEVMQRRGDARSDVYSLGVLLFESLTGEVPFKGASEWEVLRQHETEVPAIPPMVLEPERSVIERCLAKDPDDRFASVAAMLDALEGSFAPEVDPAPAPVTPASVPTAAPRTGNRVHWALSFAAVLVIAAAVPALFLIAGLRTHQRAHDAVAMAVAPAASPTSRALVGTMIVGREPRELRELRYPKGTTVSKQRFVEKYVNAWPALGDDEDRERRRILVKLESYRDSAVAFAINALVGLDLDSDDNRVLARRLDLLLAQLTGQRPKLRAGEDDAHHADGIASWWEYARRDLGL